MQKLKQYSTESIGELPIAATGTFFRNGPKWTTSERKNVYSSLTRECYRRTRGTKRIWFRYGMKFGIRGLEITNEST